MQVTHIHNVLDLLAQQSHPVTQEILMILISREFGPEIMFKSCSDRLLGKEQVVDFLHNRGKINLLDGKIQLRDDIQRC